ncbi:cuscuta receptor 1 [Hevea brasiliensis]|uniref:cuscuta receptor 1 n=1 Tax=Hevea brasiliensis TaxID=3981 RepID=UPI0025D65202|nr:cuscuta receptor 1 [Hevea brasiliensis]
MEKLPSLKTLLLSYCRLSGTIPAAKGLCELIHLQEIDISNNNLSGTLPSCLANLTSLQRLDLSSNHFTGYISLSPLRTLTSLHILQLSSNLFQIPISLLPFFNHSKLKFLYCYGNEIYADIDMPNLTPKFQLENLDFSGQGDGGVFPKFLYYQHKLQYVDMSNIKMKGEFPHWLIGNNSKLDTLSLANCSLSGPLHLPIHSHVYISHLDLFSNYFTGSIPTEIGVSFPNLDSLYLSRNGLIGGIPSSIGKMSLLRVLELSNNRLSGIIPQDLTVGCISLSNLILSNNNLQGQIFPKHADFKELKLLWLDGNQFTGSIPYGIVNCTGLQILDVSDNHLSGSIPGWIRNLTSLEVMDLSQNNFSGNLPSNFGPQWIREVYLSKNRLQGALTNAFCNCSELMILDLRHNYFSGRVPEWIDKFSELSYLLLGYNNLEGEIPIQLCNLRQLSLVDLSNNNLSGHILPCISAASNWQKKVASYGYPGTYMKQPLEFTTKRVSYYFQGSILKLISGLDLSCNNLTGKIPTEIGNLRMIQVLNLSHNRLTGLIPQSFSSLSQIESLDLSYNNLNGKIPQLTQLHFLAVFSVAHNNLSGKTPEMVAQFATFENSSYEGNPFLCGPPLSKSCFPSPVTPRVPEEDKTDHKKDGGFMDMDAFYVSFLISYAIVLLTIAVVLYINPYWRRAWFYMMETSLTNFYYFLADNIPFVFRCY